MFDRIREETDPTISLQQLADINNLGYSPPGKSRRLSQSETAINVRVLSDENCSSTDSVNRAKRGSNDRNMERHGNRDGRSKPMKPLPRIYISDDAAGIHTRPASSSRNHIQTTVTSRDRDLYPESPWKKRDRRDMEVDEIESSEVPLTSTTSLDKQENRKSSGLPWKPEIDPVTGLRRRPEMDRRRTIITFSAVTLTLVALSVGIIIWIQNVHQFPSERVHDAVALMDYTYGTRSTMFLTDDLIVLYWRRGRRPHNRNSSSSSNSSSSNNSNSSSNSSSSRTGGFLPATSYLIVTSDNGFIRDERPPAINDLIIVKEGQLTTQRSQLWTWLSGANLKIDTTGDVVTLGRLSQDAETTFNILLHPHTTFNLSLSSPGVTRLFSLVSITTENVFDLGTDIE